MSYGIMAYRISLDKLSSLFIEPNKQKRIRTISYAMTSGVEIGIIKK